MLPFCASRALLPTTCKSMDQINSRFSVSALLIVLNLIIKKSPHKRPHRQTVAHVENLDMKEINHMPSKKDLTEAKIHHMLSEEMAKPQKHFRKLSYR